MGGKHFWENVLMAKSLCVWKKVAGTRILTKPDVSFPKLGKRVLGMGNEALPASRSLKQEGS